jgi:hypothetical protein
MNTITNKIRRITVGLDMKNQMSYYLKGRHTIPVEDQKVTKEITLILEEEKYYLIFLGEDHENQLWKRIPKNDLTTVEYVID